MILAGLAILTASILLGFYEYERWVGISLIELAREGRVGSVLLEQILYVARQCEPTLISLKILGAYFGLIYLLTFIAPGYYVKGAPIRDGRVLKFYCNGLSILFIMVGTFYSLGDLDLIEWTIAYDHFGGLFSWCLIISTLVSLFLFIRGRVNGAASGNGFIEDFVMGQELVPEVLGLKLNFFWLRPSMMLWLFINLSFLAKHYQVNSGVISHSMILYQVFTNAYVVDYFVFEEFVSSTWDIIAEKFGFMLVWGDLVFIPFTFTIQGWFLIHDQTFYKPHEIAFIVSIFVVGYLIFRLANRQKHMFKKDPKGLIWGKEPIIIGGRLLASGWWGLASHINYLGDLILAIAYSAPCGFRFKSTLPWFYFIYLFILLIHRDWRDDSKCSEKYGKVWKLYRQRVPYRILPYVY